jgi:hypothetical protein
MAKNKAKKSIKTLSKGLQSVQAAKVKLPPYVRLRTKTPPKS